MMKRTKCVMLALAAIALAPPASARERGAITYQAPVDARVLPVALANGAPEVHTSSAFFALWPCHFGRDRVQ